METVLYKKENEEISDSGYLDKNITITDALIKNFYNEVMGKEEKILLDLLLSPNPTQEKLDELLPIWDIETKPAGKSLLLAYFLKTHPELHATDYEEPRLKGLLLHQRFMNLQTSAHYTKIGKALNNKGILPLLFQNGVMKVLNPDFPQYMMLFDILVTEKQWVKSAKIAKSLGFWLKKTSKNCFSVMENKDSELGVLSIHNFLHFAVKHKTKWLKGLFKRASEQDVYGVKTIVPCYEDLLFITLMNLSYNLKEQKSQNELLYAIFNCKYLIDNKPDFDWSILTDNAKLAGCEVQLNLAIKFIKKISEDIFPDKIQNNMLFEKETNDYSRMIMFKNFYYVDLQKQARKTKLGDVIKNPKGLGSYLKLKLKYKTLKVFFKHPRLIEIFINDLCKIYNIQSREY